mmetsp:Transcript_5412/g.7304  ORF Transcript_5412/g.7304 Transcript_5412/m.7304 type:complete len:325 (-) Transcript_5412:221-1195(-)|eukprot:CAMPEP_0116058978 /NCGR_PEP_ID=MMETSP0322-20121206/5526_1 /TAXON_ID=163516 /ORGANISM="Leptocylindrus danicus var. apora, Strain B651" /LENGTH=324 /DNA_ID=CAMNT_0003543279 /DNA_START=105 /DNA_END=1079 /DNA_ORIENTATION=+
MDSPPFYPIPKMQHVFSIALVSGKSITMKSAGPKGTCTFTEIVENESSFQGSKSFSSFHGKIVSPSNYSICVHPDGTISFDMRLLFRTHDEKIIFVTIHGKGVQNNKKEDDHMSSYITFETDDHTLNWLNRKILVGKGSNILGNKIEIEYYNINNDNEEDGNPSNDPDSFGVELQPNPQARHIFSANLVLKSATMKNPGPGPNGIRVFAEIIGIASSFQGGKDFPNFHGKVIAPSSDWICVCHDGTVCLDVRMLYKTHDGGLVCGNVIGRAVRDIDDPTKSDIKVMNVLETNEDNLKWLNGKVLVGKGRKLGIDKVMIDYYDLN